MTDRAEGSSRSLLSLRMQRISRGKSELSKRQLKKQIKKVVSSTLGAYAVSKDWHLTEREIEKRSQLAYDILVGKRRVRAENEAKLKALTDGLDLV